LLSASHQLFFFSSVLAIIYLTLSFESGYLQIGVNIDQILVKKNEELLKLSGKVTENTLKDPGFGPQGSGKTEKRTLKNLHALVTQIVEKLAPKPKFWSLNLASSGGKIASILQKNAK
jgi:hypothetical protein